MQHKKMIVIGIIVAATAVFHSCNKGLDISVNNEFGALPEVVISPADNQPTADKIILGKMLFFDPVLSGTKEVSCATCHNPTMGFTDGLDLPIGVNGSGFGSNRRFIVPNNIPFTKRNAPTLLNVAFNGMNASGNYDPVVAPMFYDLRAKSLEKQSLHPIATLEEMRGRNIAATDLFDTIINRLKAISQYQSLFAAAFGNNAITTSNLAKALAAFERTLVAANAPFDRYIKGDVNAMTTQQKRGMTLFVQNGCNTCHNGPMFSDYKTHVLGVADNDKLMVTDNGINSSYAFRTPTLRNLKFTAPYMHNGTQRTLDDVLAFYDGITRGGAVNAHVGKAQLDSSLRARVTLSKDLIDFLNALSDEGFDKSFPATVPSGLPVGGNIR